MRNDSRFLIEEPGKYFELLEESGTDKEVINQIKLHSTSIMFQEIRTESVKSALEGNTDTLIVDDYRGIPVLSSYAPLNIADVNWVILSEIDMKEVLVPLYAIGNKIFLLTVIVSLLVTIIAVSISDNLSTAILQLVKGANSIATGDFTNKININRTDELGYLATSLNYMRIKLDQSGRSLKESEKRYRLLLESLKEGVYQGELGKEGAFTWVNQTAAEMFGYKSPEEMIGTKVNEIYVNIDDGRTQLEMLEKYGVLSNTVYLCKNKSGDCFYAECSSHLVKDKKGKQCRIEGIIRVITERKKSENRLIAQHAVTKILSESGTIKVAFQGILKVICEALDWNFGSLWLQHEHDYVLRCLYLWHVPDLQFSEFKKKTKEISFLPGIGLPGRVLSNGKAAWINDVVVESNFPRATAASKVGLHGAFAFPIIANTEILGVIEFFSQKPEEPDKELLNMMEAIGSQVGQFIKRKQADEQVSKLSRAVEQSPVSVVITDTKNNIEYVNRKYTEVTGYSLEEVKGKNPIVLKTVEENVEEHKELWKTITSGKEWQGEFCNFNKNGEIYWESESISPIKNCDGIITGFIQLKEDITERKLVQSHLKTQLEVAKVLAESNTIREASTRIIEVVCIALGWDLGEVWIYDKQQYILRNTEIWHLPSLNFSEFKDITCRTTFSPQKGLPGLVWQTAKPLWIEDVARDSNFLRASVADKEGLHGAFGFPIAIDNVVLGTICFFSREIRRPDDKLLNMMSSIGNHIALFIERKQ
ncbi:diguanylate cyclase/phosphodiesterase, partial [Candidatus Scalindua japonica]